jgi:hypothetical protein
MIESGFRVPAPTGWNRRLPGPVSGIAGTVPVRGGCHDRPASTEQRDG